jgi:hypothetical protein
MGVLLIMANMWGQFPKAASWGLSNATSPTSHSQAAHAKIDEFGREKNKHNPHRTAPPTAPTNSCGLVGTFRSGDSMSVDRALEKKHPFYVPYALHQDPGNVSADPMGFLTVE